MKFSTVACGAQLLAEGPPSGHAEIAVTRRQSEI